MGLIRRRSSFFSSSSSPLKCFGFSFATTVPRETSEKRAHKTHNAHNATVAQRWCFTGEILFSISSIFGENQWIQDGFNGQI
jgi:hypothetical protein